MRSREILAIGLIPVLLLYAACDTGEGTRDKPPLPNSVADTSARPAQRAIPTYGPPEGADSVRTYDALGQVLYVPVYSHVFHRAEDRTFDLAATLSIRNTSLTDPITIHVVDYFDSAGTILKSYLERPRSLEPLASTYVVIEERDRAGGVGANFIVTWEAERPVTVPVVETVMISTHRGQGVSFTSQARVIQEW